MPKTLPQPWCSIDGSARHPCTLNGDDSEWAIIAEIELDEFATFTRGLGDPVQLAVCFPSLGIGLRYGSAIIASVMHESGEAPTVHLRGTSPLAK